jgi:hypothetical protein
MTNNRWKMCVVGFVIAWPVVCTATTISDAVAAADDGKYVQMDPGSSITLSFGADCSGTNPAVIVKLAQASSGIRVEFYYDGAPLSYFNGEYWVVNFETGDTAYTELGAYWEAVPFDSVKITAYGDDPVYLDAVQAGGTLIVGTYVGHTGTVTALPDDPAAMVEDLIDLVTSYNLQQGIDNSLDAKLASASDALEDVNANNDAAAVNKLEAFISEVEVQRGKKLEAWQADELHGEADAIIAVLTAP